MNTQAVPFPIFTNELIGSAEKVCHYGAIFTRDDRDHNLSAYVPVQAQGLPMSYYPNLDGITHMMQNKLGACVGHAAAKSQQVVLFHETGKIIPLSARFLYAMAKCVYGGADYQGTDPRMVAKIMKNYGCATEAICHNDTLLSHDEYIYHGDLKNIPASAIEEAKQYKITNFAFPDVTEIGIKSAIQFAGENNGGVMMLLTVDKSWYTAKDGRVSWADADIDPIRPPTDIATLGGHEIYPYAFDFKNGRTILLLWNSWGETWANKGNCFIYLDEWLPHIAQVLVTFNLPDQYTAAGWSHNFATALKKGQSGSEVVALQHALKIDGEFQGKLTGFFGDITEQAVIAFQNKYAVACLAPAGLASGTGFVGTFTLKKLNALFNHQ